MDYSHFPLPSPLYSYLIPSLSTSLEPKVLRHLRSDLCGDLPCGDRYRDGEDGIRVGSSNILDGGTTEGGSDEEGTSGSTVHKDTEVELPAHVDALHKVNLVADDASSVLKVESCER